MPPVYRLYALRGFICGQHVQWLFVRAGLFFKSCTLLLKSSNLFLLPKKSLLERIIFIALAWHFAPHATDSFCQPAAGGVRDWIRAIHGAARRKTLVLGAILLNVGRENAKNKQAKEDKIGGRGISSRRPITADTCTTAVSDSCST